MFGLSMAVWVTAQVLACSLVRINGKPAAAAALGGDGSVSEQVGSVSECLVEGRAGENWKCPGVWWA